MVSESILDGEMKLFIHGDAYQIFEAGFLLVADDKYTGFKPFRTYEGFRYEGGFSDHLPIFIDIYHNNPE
jgi:hypothetical protein